MLLYFNVDFASSASSCAGKSSHCTSSDRLHSVLEEPSQERISGSSSDLGRPMASSSPSTYRNRHKKDNPYRLSSVIKLEYDVSNPVYNKVKNLILKYVLQWFQTSSQKGSESLTSSWPPLPTVLPPQESQSPNGIDMIKKMWFTSRDNVSLLLEICRHGFHHTMPIKYSRQVVDLYRSWYQVSNDRDQEGLEEWE